MQRRYRIKQDETVIDEFLLYYNLLAEPLHEDCWEILRIITRGLLMRSGIRHGRFDITVAFNIIAITFTNKKSNEYITYNIVDCTNEGVGTR